MKRVKSALSLLGTSGAPSPRSMLTSLVIHVVAVVLLLLIPARALGRSTRPKELEVVFHRPRPPIEVPVKVAPPPLPEGAGPAPGNAPEKPPGIEKPKPTPKEPPPGRPDLPPGPEGLPDVQTPPKPNIGKVGILAFRDKFASLKKDSVAPRLGADARFSDAENSSRSSSPSILTTTTPGSSHGIDTGSLNRNVRGAGGGGGGGGDGAAGGMQGVSVGRATSSIAGIGGGDRPLARGGPGPSRTDEEIQIVFDRYKAQFYRLYNRALRNDPTLRGQMVLRLTIEPDGSVSMCKLQSTDMNAPDLAEQVVNITRTINFGAKEGVQALTISYPIDFLPAE